MELLGLSKASFRSGSTDVNIASKRKNAGMTQTAVVLIFCTFVLIFGYIRCARSPAEGAISASLDEQYSDDQTYHSGARVHQDRAFDANGGIHDLSVHAGADSNNTLDERERRNLDGAITIVYIMCGEERKDELFASLKSLHLFVKTALKSKLGSYHIHVITDGSVHLKDLDFLQPRSNFMVTLHGRHSSAPEYFDLCSMEVLYIHDSHDFIDTEQILYVDSDTLWLDDPQGWWAHFESLNTMKALFGMAIEDPNGGWYKEFEDRPEGIPFYGMGSGKWGLNAGIIMMNLGKMREMKFDRDRDDYIQEFGPSNRLLLGPQSILNVYGYRHPNHIYEMPCIYNFRYDVHCTLGFPALLHGNRKLKDHHDQKTATYRHIFDVMASL